METNFEHYKDEILKMYLLSGDRCNFYREKVLKSRNCNGITCKDCKTKAEQWLQQPYKEPVIEIDWSKVPVDTPVLVRDENFDDWKKRYFAKYYRGNVYTFDNGATSWSANNVEYAKTSTWKICELAREEDIEKYCK